MVLKLFNIVQPDTAYFGEKDYQQLSIIRRMVLDFNLNLKIVPVATVREQDGLALSSRNTYLQATERAAAPVIAKYTGVLAAADIEAFTTTTTFQIMQSYRLDRGHSGPVHP